MKWTRTNDWGAIRTVGEDGSRWPNGTTHAFLVHGDERILCDVVYEVVTSTVYDHGLAQTVTSSVPMLCMTLHGGQWRGDVTSFESVVPANRGNPL